VSANAVQEETYTIAEVAERTGVTAHTLRYYERIGLLDIGRQASGHRRFSSHDLDRVVFIGRLRATAMPIREVQRYFALVGGGPSTEAERLALLEAHRSIVRDRLHELESALDAI
jgi:DNA-binding transcriptional MerR regulator